MGTNRTLATAADEYLQLTSGRYAETTNKQRKLHIGRFVRVTGDIQVRHLSQKHMEAYFYAKPDGLTYRYAPTSVNLIRAVLAAWMKFMHNRGWLTTDPLANIRPARTPRPEHVRLSADELLRCLDICKHPRDRAFVAIAINTGLRISEITSLTLQDVNLDLGEIHAKIHKSVKEDLFPINADLDTELRDWLRFYAARMPLKPHYFLVPSKASQPVNLLKSGAVSVLDAQLLPEKRMTYPSYLKNHLFRTLGLDPHRLGVHTFRRSVARIYYDQMLTETDSRDDAIRLTQDLLHHSTLTTTELYIGAKREREQRDHSLKGQPFLSKLGSTATVTFLGAPDVDSNGTAM